MLRPLRHKLGFAKFIALIVQRSEEISVRTLACPEQNQISRDSEDSRQNDKVANKLIACFAI